MIILAILGFIIVYNVYIKGVNDDTNHGASSVEDVIELLLEQLSSFRNSTTNHLNNTNKDLM